jgi:hypothetical protein
MNPRRWLGFVVARTLEASLNMASVRSPSRTISAA